VSSADASGTNPALHSYGSPPLPAVPQKSVPPPAGCAAVVVVVIVVVVVVVVVDIVVDEDDWPTAVGFTVGGGVAVVVAVVVTVVVTVVGAATAGTVEVGAHTNDPPTGEHDGDPLDRAGRKAWGAARRSRRAVVPSPWPGENPTISERQYLEEHACVCTHW
jgi:hypothetical protein